MSDSQRFGGTVETVLERPRAQAPPATLEGGTERPRPP